MQIKRHRKVFLNMDFASSRYDGRHAGRPSLFWLYRIRDIPAQTAPDSTIFVYVIFFHSKNVTR
jgi:hypothetical protein